MSLPSEILHSIFSYLGAADLKQAAQVCSIWHSLSDDDTTWRTLCHSSWKTWNKLPDKNETGWKKIYLYREAVDLQFDNSLAKLIFPQERHETETKLAAFKLDLWDKVVHESKIYAKCDPQFWNHLPRRYWASTLLNRINQQILVEKWKNFMAEGQNNPNWPIEEGAIWMAQWVQPLLASKSIYDTLDALASDMRTRLGVTTREGDELPDAIKSDLKQFLQRVCEVFANDLKFIGNTQDYYEDKNSYISTVLERRLGIPISLSVVFAALCRRIGLKVDMIGIPQHFMAGLHDPIKKCTYFIDCFNGCRIYQREDISQLLDFELEEAHFAPVSATDVYLRMFRNLLALQNVTAQDRYGHMKQFMLLGGTVVWRDKFFLATLAYSSLGLHHEAIEMLEDIKNTHDLPNTNLEYIDRELAIIKVMLKHMSSEACDLRKKEVAHKFTIGEIVKSEFDMSTRVIISYDAACVPATKQRYGTFDANTRQPYYLTVELDKPLTIEYLPQSVLAPVLDEIEIESFVDNPGEFGRYFERFDGKRFIPNDHLAYLYPWTRSAEDPSQTKQ